MALVVACCPCLADLERLYGYEFKSDQAISWRRLGTQALGKPRNPPLQELKFRTPKLARPTGGIEVTAHLQVTEKAGHQACIVVSQEAIHVGPAGRSPYDGGREDSFANCIGHTFTTQGIESQSGRSARQPTGTAKLRKDSRMGGKL